MTSFPRLAVKPVPCFARDGTTFDLAAPDQAAVCFHEIARTLSGLNRYSGRGVSVAQHCVMGARAILNERGTRLDASLFLLHDAHEAFLGDIVRPVESLLQGMLPTLAIREAIAAAKRGWDQPIYAAAGLPAPDTWSSAMAAKVKSMDERMALAEAVAGFGPRAASQFPRMTLPLTRGAVIRWGAAKAEEQFISMANDLIGQEKIVHQAAIAAAARATR
ncbi:hypothetical protein [Rhizobium sp. RU36D]|uniref:hypothetical protein n=1 Tax=Rhizobium sp. RU36D TaxID=1907415 RepID=UPI0009D856B5|nr:hypothetical protein [Rhizobium sp. RU36D]SMD18614.1 hypothetical protein SAMN05880593_13549 [Rhizobium sp. RU36D]